MKNGAITVRGATSMTPLYTPSVGGCELVLVKEADGGPAGEEYCRRCTTRTATVTSCARANMNKNDILTMDEEGFIFECASADSG